jgi:flagellar basal-body rod modification protein FlgD
VTAPLTSTTATGKSTDPAAAIGQAVAGGSMGKDAFVKLLVAQMTHQDPLAPSDATQMAAQLAQFSSVEQLMNINTAIGAQAGASNALLTAINNSTAMGMVGKTVSVQSDQIAVGAGGNSSIQAAIPSTGGKIVLHIFDSNGNTVATQDLGTMNGGSATIPIDAYTKGLSAGTYHVTIDCTDASGAVTNPSTLVTAKIDGIRFGTNGAVLTSGTRTFPISAIASVNSGN